MNDVVVLDSSALLALINEELGCDQVTAVLSRCIMSSVNLAEVVGKLNDKGFILTEIADILHELIPDIRPFTARPAVMAGGLRAPTRLLGLSLGDRACLALAMELKATVMTCDRAWSHIPPAVVDGVIIDVVR